MTETERHIWGIRGTGFYACTIADARAHVWVNVTAPHGDWKRFPYLQQLRVHLNSPTSTGLSGADELDRILEINDRLSSSITDSQQLIYVGQITTCGYCEFYFYAETKEINEDRFQAVIDAAPEYEFLIAEGISDPNWNNYFDVIYPDAIDVHYIVFQRVLQHILDSEIPISVVYYFYLDDAAGLTSTFDYLSSLDRFELSKHVAAPRGQFRIDARTKCPISPSEVYPTLLDIVLDRHDILSSFTHCEYDVAGIPYHQVPFEAKCKIAVDVDAGLRPESDLDRFGIRLGPARTLESGDIAG